MREERAATASPSPRLTTDSDKRKEIPVATGVVDYFPDALVAIAELSFIGNQQHNPGEPLHWARGKSTDEADTLIRHFIERGTLDEDGIRHSAKVAWRALALLQKEIELELGLPMSRGSRLAPTISDLERLRADKECDVAVNSDGSVTSVRRLPDTQQRIEKGAALEPMLGQYIEVVPLVNESLREAADRTMKENGLPIMEEQNLTPPGFIGRWPFK